MMRMKGFSKTAAALALALVLVVMAPLAAAAQSADQGPAAEPQYDQIVVLILNKLGAGGDVDKFQQAGIAPRAAVVLAAIADLSGHPVDEMIGLARGGQTLPEIAEKVGVEWQKVQDKVAEAIGFKGDDQAKLQDRLAKLQERLAKAQETYRKLLQAQTDLEQRIADARAKLDGIKNENARRWAEQWIKIMEMREPILKLQIERAQAVIDLLQKMIAEITAQLTK